MKKLLFYSIFISYICLGYVDFIGQYSIGNVALLLVGAGFLAVSMLKGRTKVKKNIFNIIFCLSLICLGFLIADLSIGFNMEVFMRYTIKVLIVPSLAIIASSIFIRNADDQKKTLFVLTAIVAISSVVAILQYLGVDSMWKLRLLIQMPTAGPVYSQIVNRTTIPGLAYFNVTLCYQLVTVFPFAVGMYLYYPQKSYHKFFYGFCVIILLITAIASKSLSAMVGMLFSLFSMFFLLRRHVRLPLKNIGTIIIIFIIVLTLTGRYKEFIAFDSSTMGRIPLALAGILSISERPLGHGSHEPEAYKFYNMLSGMRGADNILTNSSHNSFINIGIGAGVIGLAAGVFGYIYVYKLFRRRLRQSNDFFPIYLNASSVAFMIGYFVQSSTHNTGMFYGDVLPWLLVGLVLKETGTEQQV